MIISDGTSRYRLMIDNPATPTRKNVTSPSTSRISGMSIRRGVSQIVSSRPTTAASRTGSLSSDFRKSHVADGTCERPLLRPSSSARPLVCVSEKSGWPVAIVSIAIQISGPAAATPA
jgi:hypothetical protein